MKTTSDRMTRLKTLVKAFSGDGNATDPVPLEGDAGARCYYRFHSGGRSWILMDNRKSVNVSHDPFILTAQYLSEIGLPVPFIQHTWESDGVLVLEDLTDTTLQHRFMDNPESTMKTLYPKVLDILVRMHRNCQKIEHTVTPAFQIRFNSEKYMEELHFFKTHFLGNHLGIEISENSHRLLESAFLWLSESLSAEPDVFTHRDFHSRNLMVKNNDIYMIDFQDARMGVMEYDLASLLRDAYVRLPEQFIADFLMEYYGSMEITSGSELHHHRYIFGLMCLQRNIKALGTFGFQASVRHKPMYLEYVPVLYDHLSHQIEYLNEQLHNSGKTSEQYEVLVNLIRSWLPI